MCAGPEIAAMVAMVGGSIMQAKAQRDAANRTASAIETGQQNQDAFTNKKNALVMQNLNQYDPTARAAAQTTAQNTATDELTKAIGDATGGRGPEATGKVSGDYLASQAASKAKELDRATTLARLMGKVRAPTDLRFQEGLNNAQFGSQESILGGLAGNQARADSLKTQLAGQVDPRLMLLGQLLQSGGEAYTMGQFMKPPTPAPVAHWYPSAPAPDPIYAGD